MQALDRIQVRVCAGRGWARRHLAEDAALLEWLLGAPPCPGTLNTVALRPLLLNPERATRLVQHPGLIWPARLGDGEAVLIYRWPGCPAHVAELVAARHLRSARALCDGDALTLHPATGAARRAGPVRELLWRGLWAGREARFYHELGGYAWLATRAGRCLGLAQSV